MKKEAQVLTIAAWQGMDQVIDYFSDWSRLKQAVAWLSRFKTYLVNNHRSKTSANQNTKDALTGDLKVEEIQSAENDILRYVQEKAFCQVLSVTESSDAGQGEKKNCASGSLVFTN